MKKLLITFTAVSILAFSCRAPEDLDRDKFEGTWSGRITSQNNCGSSQSSNSSDGQIKIVKDGTSKMKITVVSCNTNCPVFMATAKGNSLNTEDYNQTTSSNGTTATSTWKATSFVLSGSDLNATMPIEVSVNGIKVNCLAVVFALKK